MKQRCEAPQEAGRRPKAKNAFQATRIAPIIIRGPELPVELSNEAVRPRGLPDLQGTQNILAHQRIEKSA